jgi:hypothetical protein
MLKQRYVYKIYHISFIILCFVAGASRNILDAQFIYSIYRQPLHGSGVSRPIIRRYTVWIQKLVLIILFRRLSLVLVGLELLWHVAKYICIWSHNDNRWSWYVARYISLCSDNDNRWLWYVARYISVCSDNDNRWSWYVAKYIFVCSDYDIRRLWYVARYISVCSANDNRWSWYVAK